MSRKKTVFVDLAKLGSATVIAQIVSFMCAPILCRLFSPEAFGKYTLFNSIAAIFSAISCLRYNVAIARPESHREANKLVRLCFVILIVFVTIIAASSIIFRNKLASTIGIKDNYEIFLLLTMIFIGGTDYIFDAIITRLGKFGAKSSASLINGLSNTSCNLVLGGLGYVSGFYLIISSLIAKLSSVIWQLIVITRGGYIEGHENKTKNNNIFQLANRYRKFAIYDTWSTLLNVSSNAVAPMIIAYYFSLADVGQFSKGVNLILLPMTIVGTAAGQVLYQRFCNYSDVEVAKMIRESIVNLCVFGFTGYFSLLVMAPSLFTFYFGSEWTNSGVYASYLSPWCFLAFVSSPISAILYARDKQEANLTFNICSILLRSAALICGGIANNIHLSLILYSAVGFIISLILVIYIIKLVHLTIREIVSRVMRYATTIITSMLIIICAAMLVHDEMIKIIIILLSVKIYYICIFIQVKQYYKQDVL